MAANVLNILGKLTKKRTTEKDIREENMPANEASKKERAAKKEERVAQREQKRQGRSQRQTARKNKSGEAAARPQRLCSLATVEVRKDSDGFQVSVNGSGGRRAFTIAASDASQVLRDLETAIQVMRGQG